MTADSPNLRLSLVVWFHGGRTVSPPPPVVDESASLVRSNDRVRHAAGDWPTVLRPDVPGRSEHDSRLFSVGLQEWYQRPVEVGRP